MGLLHHLACGIGKPFSVPQTRAAMAARLHTLGLGHSAVSDATLDSLALFLNENITPIVPSIGSVGASGDLTPLAHIALALCGEGKTEIDAQHQLPSQSHLQTRKMYSHHFRGCENSWFPNRTDNV